MKNACAKRKYKKQSHRWLIGTRTTQRRATLNQIRSADYAQPIGQVTAQCKLYAKLFYCNWLVRESLWYSLFRILGSENICNLWGKTDAIWPNETRNVFSSLTTMVGFVCKVYVRLWIKISAVFLQSTESCLLVWDVLRPRWYVKQTT